MGLAAAVEAAPQPAQLRRPARSRRRSAPGSTPARARRRGRRGRGTPRRRAPASPSSGWPPRGRPRCRGQQRLGGAGRARVERGDPVERRVHEEEGDADRDLQRVPLRRRQPEVGEGEVAVGHGPEAAAAGAARGEQQVAAPAGAHQAAVLEVDDVAVLVGRSARRTARSARPGAGAAARPACGCAAARRGDRSPRTGRRSRRARRAASGGGVVDVGRLACPARPASEPADGGVGSLDVDDRDLRRGLEDRPLDRLLQRHGRRRAAVAAARAGAGAPRRRPRRRRAARRRRRGRRGTVAPSRAPRSTRVREVVGMQAVHHQQAGDELVVGQPCRAASGASAATSSITRSSPPPYSSVTSRTSSSAWS